MNSLYTSAMRQTNSIQADLDRLRQGESSAALLGQISASLAAMHRTVDDYDSMAKREIMKAKQEKAQMRVQKFRTDYTDFKNEFERLKTHQQNAQRSELLASTSATTNPMTPSDARRRTTQPFPASSSLQPSETISESPFRGPSPMPNHNSGYAPNQSYMQNQFAALDEHSFIQNTEAKLDEFLAQGTEVLNGLIDQRNMLKGTQRRLLDAANTLGLSRDVIGWIERRSKQDIWIFWAGAVFTFFCFWLIWHYLG